jgi:hypothetical protein
MVETIDGDEVARVTLVDAYTGNIALDTLILPEYPVEDYHRTIVPSIAESMSAC